MIVAQEAWTYVTVWSAGNLGRKGGERVNVRDLKLQVVTQRSKGCRIVEVNTNVVYATVVEGPNGLKAARLFRAAPDLLHTAEWFVRLYEELARLKVLNQLAEPDTVTALYHEAKRVIATATQ